MVEAHEIPDKCFRALTCAAISGARQSIKKGKRKRVLDELAFANDEGHIFWEALELLCNIDVENVRGQLIALAKARLDYFDRKLNPRQLRLF